MNSLRPKAAFLSAVPIPIRGHAITPCPTTNRRPTTRAAHATMSVVLAPGQGAQSIDMGKSWREISKSATGVFEAADEALGNSLGAPLSKLISSAETDAVTTLSRTDVAQPAIFVTSMACWAGMQDVGVIDAGALTVTAGLSLGEYTALTIAGAIRFEDALRLVTLRGQAMQQAAEASDSGMLALIGATDEVAQEVVEACKDSSVLVAANFNAPGQVVLSGSSDAIARASAFASEERKLRVAKLDVAGAFHSPLMEPAAEKLAEALKDTEIFEPTVPVLSNVTAQPHTADTVRELLVKQLTNPVRWAKCCEYIKNNEPFAGAKWIELAPGRTLSGIMRKIDRKVKITNYSDAPVEAEV